MAVNKEKYRELSAALAGRATLVAVSKTRPVTEILELYEAGHRDFGENYVQELLEKQPVLPADIRWHFIGHLQSNKVKSIAPFIHLIHSVDSLSLLREIDKQSNRCARQLRCLLQVHIAEEDTKYGFSEEEVLSLELPHPGASLVCGLMGMATFTGDEGKIRAEFKKLNRLFRQLSATFAEPPVLSTGMSGDYQIALEEGSNMVRIGSLLFGERVYAS
jgi:hypothetical protein